MAFNSLVKLILHLHTKEISFRSGLSLFGKHECGKENGMYIARRFLVEEAAAVLVSCCHFH